MHHKVTNTFDTYAAATYDKQVFLNEIIEGQDASFDLSRGRVNFGALSWRCQVLGIQPDTSNRFRWIWSVDQSNIPNRLMKWSHSVREVGIRDGIPELVEAEPTDPDCDGHLLSMMATGICRANAYFCGEYQDATVFLLIRDPQYPVSNIRPIHRLVSNLPRAISHLPIDNHRRAVTGHARFLGLNVRKERHRILIDDGEQQVTATFDDEKRLLNLSRVQQPDAAMV